eukprot:EG_transcript_16365
MAIQKRARLPFPGEPMPKRRRTAGARVASGGWDAAAEAPPATCAFVFQWDPSQVLPPNVKPPPAPGDASMEMEATALGPLAKGFTFGPPSPGLPAAGAPTFSFLALGALPSARTGARARCARGPCPTVRSPGGTWRPKGARRLRRGREPSPEREEETAASSEAEEATERRPAPGAIVLDPAPVQPSVQPPAAAAVSAPAVEAPEAAGPAPAPCDRMIALLCELIKGISLTSACVPVLRRRHMDRAMLLKRIDALCIELEHQFDTINTLRNLADEASTAAEAAWLQQQRERVEGECAAIEQEIDAVKAVLALPAASP